MTDEKKPYRSNRVTLDNCLFEPLTGQHIETAPLEEKYTMVYTVLGRQDYLDEYDFPRLAKQEKKDGRGKEYTIYPEDRQEAYARKTNGEYFVKRGRRGRFFNPIGLYTETDSNKETMGRKEWVFDKVTQKVFNLYVDFLRTKNPAYLRNAEREI